MSVNAIKTRNNKNFLTGDKFSKMDLSQINGLFNSAHGKTYFGRKLGLTDGSDDNFSEFSGPVAVKINTNLGRRIMSLKSQENKANLLNSVTGRAEKVLKTAGKVAGQTEKVIRNFTDNTGTFINTNIIEPVNAAKEKINEAAHLATKGADFILHIPGHATEALGQKVAKVYEKAEKKITKKVEPLTSKLANVSKVIESSVHTFSDNISSIVGEVIFHSEKSSGK